MSQFPQSALSSVMFVTVPFSMFMTVEKRDRYMPDYRVGLDSNYIIHYVTILKTG